MTNKLLSWPIRRHLIILILLLAIPSMLLIVRSGMEARDEAIDEAKKASLAFVESIAAEEQTAVTGIQQLAATIALLPAVQMHDGKAVNSLLQELLKNNPQLNNIAIAGKSGAVWASGSPVEGKVSFADRRYFKEALRTGMFSSGEYSIGKIVKTSHMSFGYPVKNDRDETIAVIGITLNLGYAQKAFEKVSLPPGASFSLLDHQGIVLAGNRRDSLSTEFTGSRDFPEEMFTTMLNGPEVGTWEPVGNDGQTRLSTYKRLSLPHETEAYLYIRSCIPLTSATAHANAKMIKNLAAFGSLFAITLILAWFVGEHAIVKPITMLKEASEQLGAGAATIKVAQLVKGGELGELAQSFDSMTGALAKREAETRIAQSALRENEQRWATTLASIGDAVIAIDIEGRITFMNTVAENLTGWKLENAAMKPLQTVFNIISEHTGTEVCSIADELIRDGGIASRADHIFLVKKDGTTFPIDKSGAPIRDKDGSIVGAVFVFHDITERRQTEEHLRNEKLRLEVAQESAQAGTFEWNIQKKETIWSDQLKALYGFSPGEFKGFENWSTRVHPEDLRKSKKAILESLKTGRYDDDFRIVWPDGSLHWLAARGTVVYDEHGTPIFMTGINMDITERKRYEQDLTRSRDELEEKVRERTRDLSRTAEELRKSEEAYRFLVELNPVGVYRHFYDPANRICKRLHCNEAHLNFLGYSSLTEYLKGKPEETILIDDWSKYISSLISEGKIVNYPAQMNRRDGKVIWVLINATARADGDYFIIEGAMTDISEQKRTEDRLRVARKKLRAMASEIVLADERSRQHLAADLHDTVIQSMGAAKMRSQLIQDEVPERVLSDFRELQDLLSQSIAQARLIMAEMSPPVLNELGFIPALEWLTEQTENQHGIKTDFSIDGFTPLKHEIQVLLFQATRELLMNVVKHAGAGKALIKVSARDQKMRIEVIDDGRGFDALQAFRTDVSSGGFGLFSIRERIRHFGGHLAIQSEKGKGTRIVMTIPAVRAGKKLKNSKASTST